MQAESLSQITLIGIEAALLAGDILRHGFGSHYAIFAKKGRLNLVTEYDRLSEKAIIKFIRENAPESHFLAEESGKSGKKSSLSWIIDPLDGTVNFAHHIPHFAVSIAAVKEGIPLCGIVYLPMTSELFLAEKNRGAFLNGKKIHVSETSRLDKAFLATGFPYNLVKNPHRCIERFTKVLRLGIPIRRLGSAAADLAYTAAGRYDGFFEAELQPWDYAAGCIIVEEAGGKVTDWAGKRFDLFKRPPLLATNGKIHGKLAKVLQK